MISKVPKPSSLKQDVTVQLQLDVDGNRSVVLSLFKNARNSGHYLQSLPPSLQGIKRLHLSCLYKADCRRWLLVQVLACHLSYLYQLVAKWIPWTTSQGWEVPALGCTHCEARFHSLSILRCQHQEMDLSLPLRRD